MGFLPLCQELQHDECPFLLVRLLLLRVESRNNDPPKHMQKLDWRLWHPSLETGQEAQGKVPPLKIATSATIVHANEQGDTELITPPPPPPPLATSGSLSSTDTFHIDCPSSPRKAQVCLRGFDEVSNSDHVQDVAVGFTQHGVAQRRTPPLAALSRPSSRSSSSSGSYTMTPGTMHHDDCWAVDDDDDDTVVDDQEEFEKRVPERPLRRPSLLSAMLHQHDGGGQGTAASPSGTSDSEDRAKRWTPPAVKPSNDAILSESLQYCVDWERLQNAGPVFDLPVPAQCTSRRSESTAASISAGIAASDESLADGGDQLRFQGW